LVYGVETGLLLTIIYFLSVIFHEYGHVWAAQRCDATVKSVRVFALGGAADIVWDPKYYSTSREAWIYLGGPAASLMLSAFSAFLWPLYPFPIATYLFVINLLLLLLNLFPVIPLDGGRILTAVLAGKYTRRKASKISIIVGITLGIPLLGFLVGLGAHALSLLVFLVLLKIISKCFSSILRTEVSKSAKAY